MFEDEIDRYLPWSARRYEINVHGQILDKENNIIVPYEKDGQMHVDLEWIFGKRDYLVALVLLVCLKKISIPHHLFDEVEPVYKDGNSKNLFPTNILYRFKNGPLPVEHYPGFYYVPFFNDYGITIDGRLMNVNTGREKVWSVTKGGGKRNETGGYLYNRVLTTDGFSKCFFLHRALCLVFKRYENNVFEIVVNHKDGRPSNNKLDNLEWMTYSENNLHAYENNLRPNSSRSVRVKDLKTGLVTEYSTIQECARNLEGITPSIVRTRIEKCPTKVFADLLLFKYGDDYSAWVNIDIDTVEICRLGIGADIVARNVFTGDLLVFRGTGSGQLLTGVKNATILRHLRDSAVIPVNGWNFKYYSLATDWPVHSVRHLQIYKDYPIYPPDGIVATDQETGEEQFFTSRSKAANYFKVTPGIIFSCINRNQRLKKKYLLKYFKLRETLGHPTK